MDKNISWFNPLLLAVVVPFFVLSILGIIYMIKVSGKMRDRNREAERLCKIVNANRILTNEEREVFRSFVKEGVISKTIDGNYALSERAIKELLEVT